jgi:serine phosphatase RsbU (regulator of sigma subunit)/CHASE2 domain-containing sensor protein
MTDSRSTSEAPSRRFALRRILRPARVAGLVTLALALALLLASGNGVLRGLELWNFDALQRRLLREPDAAARVMIVEIDDASLQRFGQWPWPRNLMAELVRRIHAETPRVLGIDILWSEPDRMSPERWAKIEGALPTDLAARLAELPDHDAMLAQAIGAGPTVIGMAGLLEGAGTPARFAPSRIVGDMPGGVALRYAGLLHSLDVIQQAAAGHGLISAVKDADGEVRRMPAIGMVGDAPVLSLALEMLRVAQRSSPFTIDVSSGAVRRIDVGGIVIPTDPDATVRLALSDRNRRVSAVDVLEGRLPAEMLRGRLVLLGVTATATNDIDDTALGPMDGIALHAQMLEDILDHDFAVRPPWTRWGEAGLLLLFGLASIAFLPGRRLGWYAPAALLPPLLMGGVSVIAWREAVWQVDAVLPSLGNTAVMVALLGGGLAEADAQRRRLRRALEDQRVKAARLEGEVEAARRIQMGILPRPETLAADARFDLAVDLEPAREVGGDLYDFFMIDARTLFISVGDVTGKGVPASLFMALGKSLYKSCVLRGDGDPASITRAANLEISRDNTEMLFITLFAGLLDLDTGRLVFCNAGHEPPYAVLPGAPPRLIEGSGGPPLCVVEGFDYVAHDYQLRPGELVFLVTDGVTEAMNPAGALLGHQPVIDCLAALPADTGASDALAALRATVARFVASAEASDDLTMLTVRWTGPAAGA